MILLKLASFNFFILLNKYNWIENGMVEIYQILLLTWKNIDLNNFINW